MVHVFLQVCDLDDAMARLTVAVKLALLLEDGDASPLSTATHPSMTATMTASVSQLAALTEARDVLKSAVAVAERFRCELMSSYRGSSDEHLRWITASRSQPLDEIAQLVAGESSAARLGLR